MDIGTKTMIYRWLMGLALGLGIGSCSDISLLLTHWPGAVDRANLPPCVDDNCNCGDFLTQTQAQAVLDAFSGDRFNLDGDGNGLACEFLPPSLPPLDPPGPPSNNPHLVLGNPSQANPVNPNNFLIERQQYTLAYSRDRHILHWASWEVDAGWLGPVDRQEDFRPDGALPQGVYQVTPNDYRGSGYDRGHVVPSGDRTRTTKDNSATFLMTNILPQAPENNRGPWRELESYTRSLVYDYDHSLHIFAGAYGQQGQMGNRGITVPARLWKIIIVYDRLDNGRLGLGPDSQIIAVDIPNSDAVSEDWRDYQTTIHRIELATGHQFLSSLPESLQAVLKERPTDIP
jgi:endonuclease G